MIPTLHPLADTARRYRKTDYGEEAEMSKEEALAVEMPTKEALWWEVDNYASAMYMTHRTADALIFSKRAVRMKRCVRTLINQAVILGALGRVPEALAAAEEANTVDPKDDRASALLSEWLLRSGDMVRGWPLYVKNRASMAWIEQCFALPEWAGAHQDVRGKKVIVIEGGGYGDNFYFLRWLDTLRRWGAHIDYVCQPSLAPLVRHLGYRAIENPSGNADIEWYRYAYHTPLLSLGAKLGVTLENYRWNGPYIKVKHSLPSTRQPRVGFCWRAGESTSQRKQRTLHNEQLARILYNLPKGWTRVNMTVDFWDTERLDEHPGFANWLATAKVMSTLDLMITVDTGVAHLAGAMGIRTWVILPLESAWQYPLGHEYHPLYPTMKIYRSAAEGLEGAVQGVIDDLGSL